MTALSHTDDERRIVEAQLGRALRGDWQVARRCHLGIPMVIENHPWLPDGSPFPTLFWLTCPMLLKRASTMEGTGAMVRVNEAVATDVGLRARQERAGGRYLARRDRLGPLEEKAVPGGVERVKCLHAHVAHELADPPNPIGARVLADAGWPDCVSPCVVEGVSLR